MTPIINPWIFYFIHIADKLIFVSAFSLAMSIVFGIVFGLGLVLEEIDISKKQMKIFIKALVMTFIISLSIVIFAPSSKTITKMLIAQNVTYERIETATDTVQSVYEDIIALFEEEN